MSQKHETAGILQFLHRLQGSHNVVPILMSAFVDNRPICAVHWSEHCVDSLLSNHYSEQEINKADSIRAAHGPLHRNDEGV